VGHGVQPRARWPGARQAVQNHSDPAPSSIPVRLAETPRFGGL